jgi:hypothetical protein
MSRIFIVYRQSDSGFLARQIADRLAGQFGAQRIVTIAQEPPQSAAVVQDTLMLATTSAVVLPIIGPAWASDPRLNYPTDLVRQALEAALAQPAVQVLPVLVGGAMMPNPQLLPPGLQPLCYRSVSGVRDLPFFEQDMQSLLGAVGRLAPFAAPQPAPPVPQPSPRRVQSPEQPIVVLRDGGSAGVQGCVWLPFRLVGQLLGFVASLVGTIIRAMVSSVVSFIMGLVILVVIGGIFVVFVASVIQQQGDVLQAISAMGQTASDLLNGLLGR